MCSGNQYAFNLTLIGLQLTNHKVKKTSQSLRMRVFVLVYGAWYTRDACVADKHSHIFT